MQCDAGQPRSELDAPLCVLQRVAACYSVLQRVAARRSVLQGDAM